MYKERVNQKLAKIDKSGKQFIRRTIYKMYQENQVPTLECIQRKLLDYPDYNNKSLETLRQILLDCRFRHKKLDKQIVIMESQRIVRLRQDYLRKIKNFRDSNRHIVYLDETWFDSHYVVNYGWFDDSKNCCLQTPSSRGKRIVILHAGSINSFVPNALLLSAKQIKKYYADYHKDMTA